LNHLTDSGTNAALFHDPQNEQKIKFHIQMILQLRQAFEVHFEFRIAYMAGSVPKVTITMIFNGYVQNSIMS
jgi:hypothetical protein